MPRRRGSDRHRMPRAKRPSHRGAARATVPPRAARRTGKASRRFAVPACSARAPRRSAYPRSAGRIWRPGRRRPPCRSICRGPRGPRRKVRRAHPLPARAPPTLPGAVPPRPPRRSGAVPGASASLQIPSFAPPALWRWKSGRGRCRASPLPPRAAFPARRLLFPQETTLPAPRRSLLCHRGEGAGRRPARRPRTTANRETERLTASHPSPIPFRFLSL